MPRLGYGAAQLRFCSLLCMMRTVMPFISELSTILLAIRDLHMPIDADIRLVSDLLFALAPTQIQTQASLRATGMRFRCAYRGVERETARGALAPGGGGVDAVPGLRRAARTGDGFQQLT